MENVGIIIIILLIGIALFILIAAIPLLFGKIFLKWSNKRVRYIFLQSMETVITNTVSSIILTGILLFIGIFLDICQLLVQVELYEVMFAYLKIPVIAGSTISVQKSRGVF